MQDEHERIALARALNNGLKNPPPSKSTAFASWIGLLNDLFNHGVGYCNEEDTDKKMLAGLATVESFLKKMDAWGGDALKQAQAERIRGGNSSNVYASLRATGGIPVLNGYEKKYIQQRYLEPDAASDMKRLEVCKQDRRAFLKALSAIGLAGGGIAGAVHGASRWRMGEEPEIQPEQQTERIAQQDLRAARQRRVNFSAYTDIGREEWQDLLEELVREEQAALKQLYHVRRLREDAGLPAYEEALADRNERGKYGGFSQFAIVCAGMLAGAPIMAGMYELAGLSGGAAELKAAQEKVTAHQVNLQGKLAAACERMAVGVEPLLQEIACQSQQRSGPSTER